MTSFIAPLAHSGFSGQWGDFRECPIGEHVIGVQLRIEQGQGRGDDTALNAIRLRCTGGKVLMSRENPYGDWGAWKLITAPDYFRGVRLRQEREQGYWGDDIAANGLRLMTNTNVQIYPGDGHWGDWSPWAWCPPGAKIAGFKTKVYPPRGSLDDLSLTEVEFLCRSYTG